VLYAVPVVIVLGSIVVTVARDRRERRENAAAEPDPNLSS
jgi:cytochrome c-type biogenesis protein CcmH/NrfF